MMRVDLSALPEHVLLGLSGGADSVALLLLLTDRGGRIEAAHVNHGLRGEASDGDEAFVRALCAEKGVPLRVYRLTPPEHPSEDWAREARYGCLLAAMRETGAEALVLAHHRDDQAETLLMRLTRGTGLTGLTAMAADATQGGMRIMRPLLGVSGQALRDMLTQRGQAWREDATNTDPRYLRNALRHEVMPLLERRAPGAARRMAETARLLREDEDALRQLAEGYLAAHGGGRALALEPLKAQPPGLQKRILRRWWAQEDLPPLNRPQTEALAGLILAPAGARCNLPGGWHGQRGWTHLHLIAPEAETPPRPVPARDGAALGGVTLLIGPSDGTTGDGKRAQVIPADWPEGLTLRTWQPGDWIRPFGMAGRKTMQDYFTDRRVDAPFRRRIPLLCRGSEVLLAGGVGAGSVPPADQEGMMLRFEGPMPWMTIRKDEEP